jgi:hypothetical protein
LAVAAAPLASTPPTETAGAGAAKIGPGDDGGRSTRPLRFCAESAACAGAAAEGSERAGGQCASLQSPWLRGNRAGSTHSPARPAASTQSLTQALTHCASSAASMPPTAAYSLVAACGRIRPDATAADASLLSQRSSTDRSLRDLADLRARCRTAHLVRLCQTS